MTLIAIFIALIFCYSLVSGRLERTIVTAPIVFTAAGMVALLFLPELRDRKGNLEVLLRSPKSAWCCCSSPTPAAPISRC